MPLEIEAHTRAGRPARGAAGPAAAARRGPILIGLINNMPDSALQSTETQFGGLLQAAAGPQAVKLRFSSLPELPRSPEALEHLARSYWPIDELLAEPPDALIVTGTEPRAPRLADEPYWQRLVQLLAWTEAHTIASVWSCLAAHAVVEILDGIQRQRLAEKRCGVYEHSILDGAPAAGRGQRAADDASLALERAAPCGAARSRLYPPQLVGRDRSGCLPPPAAQPPAFLPGPSGVRGHDAAQGVSP